MAKKSCLDDRLPENTWKQLLNGVYAQQIKYNRDITCYNYTQI